MASKKITEQALAQSLKNTASLLITQPETVNGAEVESLLRAPLGTLMSALYRMGMPAPLSQTQAQNPAMFYPEPGSPLRPVIRMEPVQSGSGDASPDNYRKITGRMATKVMRTGKNLFPGGTYNINPDGLADHDGYVDVEFDVPLPPGTYTVSALVSSTDTENKYSRIGFRDKDTTVFTYIDFSRAASRESHQITLTGYTNLIRLLSSFSRSSSAGDSSVWTDVQIQAGSEAEAYEPYQGDVFTLQLGQTVYGGTLDANSGLMIIDYACETFDGETDRLKFMEKSGVDSVDRYLRGRSVTTPNTGVVCSHAKPGKANGDLYTAFINSNGSISWNFAPYGTTTVEDINRYLREQYANGTPVQFCYKLNTPVTIQLSPTEILALTGLNTVYTDADGMELTYNKSFVREHEEVMARLAALEAAVLSNT